MLKEWTKKCREIGGGGREGGGVDHETFGMKLYQMILEY